MATDDKLRNQGEDLKGKAKETIGRATDDEELEAQGRTDQTRPADLQEVPAADLCADESLARPDSPYGHLILLSLTSARCAGVQT